MVLGLMHIHQLDTLYKSYGSKNSPGVIWGHRGEKFIFTKKCYNSYTINSMNIKCVHVHKLETFYLFCGVTGQSGVIWGCGGSNHYFDTTFIAH